MVDVLIIRNLLLLEFIKLEQIHTLTHAMENLSAPLTARMLSRAQNNNTNRFSDEFGASFRETDEYLKFMETHAPGNHVLVMEYGDLVTGCSKGCCGSIDHLTDKFNKAYGEIKAELVSPEEMKGTSAVLGMTPLEHKLLTNALVGWYEKIRETIRDLNTSLKYVTPRYDDEIGAVSEEFLSLFHQTFSLSQPLHSEPETLNFFSSSKSNRVPFKG